MTKMRIGYIGLGTMGAPMAMNILKAGFPLTVYNRTASKAADLIAAGAQWAETPAEVASRSEIVLPISQTLLTFSKFFLGRTVLSMVHIRR